MSTYLLAAVQNRHLHLCLWHVMLLGGMLVCLIEVVPLIWLFLVDQKNCPIFYFPLFVSSSQAWRHTFSFWYDDLDHTNHTFSESLSLSLCLSGWGNVGNAWKKTYFKGGHSLLLVVNISLRSNWLFFKKASSQYNVSKTPLGLKNWISAVGTNWHHFLS